MKLEQFIRADAPRSICICGHLGDGRNSEHKDSSMTPGHGRCRECDCEKFTWERWRDMLTEECRQAVHRAISTEEGEVLQTLEALPDSKFIRLFRNLLTIQRYPYPDASVVKERYMSSLVLLADVPIKRVREALAELQQGKRLPNHRRITRDRAS